MILIEQAERILNEISVSPEIEEIHLEGALGRILAQDIVSGIDMPPFNKSGMDGYAVISEDASEKYKVVEIIPAGKVPRRKIHPGECAKIMTGGIVPEAADRVIKRELAVEENGYMRITGREENKNVCIAGEDIQKGETVLETGRKIRPQEVGVIASMGLNKLKVYAKPKVGIISTGSEIVSPGKEIKPSQIYDSNSYSLYAQVVQAGAELSEKRTVGDEPGRIEETIRKLSDSCDVLLISGGVSAGDFDYVPDILKELGFTLHFEKVAVKPGKPTVFGTKNDRYVFGVPGNPVSTFVVFELFIKPFLFRMMGHTYEPFMISAMLEESIQRKRTERASYIPVGYKKGVVQAMAYHGSAHIHALTHANALLCIPKGRKGYPEGSKVYVRRI